jgi:hypothetical protein
VDLSGIPALDVVIGLAFVYFLLSLVISSLTEATSAVLQLRWRTLRRGIRELLVDGKPDHKRLDASNRALELLEDGKLDKAMKLVTKHDLLEPEERRELKEISGGREARIAGLRRLLVKGSTATRFENEPRLRALWKQTGALTKIPVIGKRGPAYIQPRTFALTLLDTLEPPGASVESHDVIDRVHKAAAEVENPLLKKWLVDAVAEGKRDREKLLAALESSFDTVTNRVSGWYKRYATLWVTVFAIVVALALNVDSYAIGSRLWKDDAVRASIAAQAANLTGGTACPGAAESEAPPADDPAAQARSELEEAADCVTAVQALGLPLGWADENRPDDAWGWLGKSFGLVVTVFALMLGAPFWFDTLSKLARLRTTGKPEGTARTDDRDKPKE